MGVALPQGDVKQVYDTIKTDNYMGWKSCTMKEAQEAADSGTAAIGISEDRIFVLSVNDEEQPVAQTASVMTLSENTSAFAVDGLEYYSYSYGTSVPINYCGGYNYRDITLHNMVLQNDGYYVCTRCGYRVKSPALQDKDVLNKSDFLTVVSLLHEYLSIVQQYPIYAEKMLAMIDAIRGLPENKTKYEYCDGNGVYVPEYNKSFGNTQMYIHVNKGSCVTEWVLLKSMYSIISAVAPFPYSIMISAISNLVAQEHLGVSQMTGADIVKSFASYLVDGVLSIPNLSLELLGKIKNAIDIYLSFSTSSDEISCTSECYNINIVTINKDEICDLHQIEYHYSNGVETMGRCSEYNVDGIKTVFPGADYYDHVNNREYDVYSQ